MKAIITLPAYADYIEKAASQDIVCAVRFNTVLPVREKLDDFLPAFAEKVAPKELWVDLKCRQLRVVNSAYVPYYYLDISHRISVNTPTEASFCSGEFSAMIRKVENGNRLVIEEISPVPLGSGMSLSIADPSLKIEGYLTGRDKEYVEAAAKAGLHNFMLSYVEQESDIQDLLALDPNARIIAKIESKKGLDFVEKIYPKYKRTVRLMAARGDLYNELERPHQILRATKQIIACDKRAIAASRIFSSMRKSRVPQSQEVGDVGFLYELGYQTLMFGDEICFQREALFSALNLLDAIDRDYA
ncbi:MAG: pyruvate kinase [Acidobacteriota bacterium]